MQVNLPPDVEKSIERRLAAGQFTSPEEVIRTAIDQMDDYDLAIADIREGLADEQAGRIHPIRDVDRELRDKYGFKRPS